MAGFNGHADSRLNSTNAATRIIISNMQFNRVSIGSAFQAAALSFAVCWIMPTFAADQGVESSPVPEVPANVIGAAREAITAGDVSAAYKLIRPFAEAGHAQAQEFVAYSYEVGIEGTLTPDTCYAYIWHDKAARQGHLDSIYKLTTLHRPGLDSDRAAREADSWDFLFHQNIGHYVPRSYDDRTDLTIQKFLARVPKAGAPPSSEGLSFFVAPPRPTILTRQSGCTPLPDHVG